MTHFPDCCLLKIPSKANAFLTWDCFQGIIDITNLSSRLNYSGEVLLFYYFAALGKMSFDILRIKTLFNNVSIAFFGFLVVASVLPPTAVRKVSFQKLDSTLICWRKVRKVKVCIVFHIKFDEKKFCTLRNNIYRFLCGIHYYWLITE